MTRWSKAAAALALAVEMGRPRASRCMALFLADISHMPDPFEHLGSDDYCTSAGRAMSRMTTPPLGEMEPGILLARARSLPPNQ